MAFPQRFRSEVAAIIGFAGFVGLAYAEPRPAVIELVYL